MRSDKPRMTALLVGVVAALVATIGLAVAERPAQETAKDGDTKSASIVGSEVKATGNSWCDDGKKQTQKVLMLKTMTEDGESEEVATQQWMEATDESCEAESELPAIPEVSQVADVGKTLAEDAMKRGETTRGHRCSRSCMYTRGRYECWRGTRYWVQYCYDECNEYTGQHYWSYQGRCW